MAEHGQAGAAKRGLIWAGGAALALIIILVAALVACSRPPLSNRLIASLLSRPGAPAKVEGAYIGFGEARIDSLTAGKQLAVADLKASYGLPGILFGKVDSIRVRSITLAAQYEGGSITLPIVGRVGGESKASGALRLPAIEASTILVSLEGLPVRAQLSGKLALTPTTAGGYNIDFAGNSNFGSELPTEISATLNAKNDIGFKVNAGLSGPGAPGTEPLASAEPGLLIDRLVAQGSLADGRIKKLDANLDVRSANFREANIGKSTLRLAIGAGTKGSFSIDSGPIQLTEAYAKELASKIEASYAAAHSQEASASLASDLDTLTGLLRGRWGLSGSGTLSLANVNGSQRIEISPLIDAKVFPNCGGDGGLLSCNSSPLLTVGLGLPANAQDASRIDLTIGKRITYTAHVGLAINGAYPPHVKIGAIDAQSSADPKELSPLTLNNVSIDWPSKKVTLGFSASKIHFAPGAQGAVMLADAKVTADGLLYDGVTAKGLAADISGTIKDSGKKWTLMPAGGCYNAAFDRLTIGPARISNGGLKACAKLDAPFVTIDTTGATPPHIEAALTGMPAVINSGSMADGIKIVSLSGDVVADLYPEHPAVHLSAVQGRIADAAKSVRFAPLDFFGAADMENGKTSGSIGATALNQVLVSAHLQQDETGAGTLDFDSGMLDFAGRKIEIQKLLPVLAGIVTQAQGQLHITGEMSWAKGKQPRSSGKIAFKDFGVTTKLGPIQGIDGTFALNRLWPARTARPQTLKIKSINVGFPLADGSATINLPEKFELDIVKAAWPWGNGELAIVDGSFVPGQQVQHVAMTASGIDLETATKLLKVDGLSATGIVDGRLPIEIDKGNASIVAGALKARSGGIIKYTGSAGAAASAQGGAGADLLFKALKNFHYDTLEIGVEGPLTGNVTIALKLRGSNPDVYDGHSFEINIKVDSQIANLILQTTEGLRIGTQIQKGLSGGQ